jgi:serine protease Do
MTRAEIEKYLEGKLLGNVTVEGGDNYNVNIELDGGSWDIVAAAKSLLSSVSVFCTFNGRETVFGSAEDDYSAGSGVIYKMNKSNGDAYIITNYHVVYNSDADNKSGIADEIIITLYGQESAAYAIPATYVGGSMEYDLAVLRIKGSRVLAESAAVAAEFADSGKLSVLDTAIAVGNAEGEGISATVGHVNVDSEYIDILGSDGKTMINLRVIRTDAAVNSGNSGGGLFNDRGQLIGLVNAKMMTYEVDNIGYAIPSNVVRYIADNILYYCLGTSRTSVYKCMLGITVSAKESYVDYDTSSGRVFKREVVEIASVDAKSDAEGLLQKGDIINSITIDGVVYSVDRIYKVVDSMLNARVGSVVVINVTRGSESVNVTVPITSATPVK